ncbi:hypothetical protein FIBSPDRAFT_927421 [Athelia psychrophila]|uniref:Tyr recombinase domain-containing protein n=1 Tax=Athelia psychrophila TaxID=1759441 RepID=A0A166RTH7_9AGAM|nr:hypothetical protein FIBSPDRAFT_927421 [Fibularhizoctonia sp. CBS 109695]
MVNLEEMVATALTDFPDDDKSDVSIYAAKLAQSCITGDTRAGHFRIAKAYIMYHRLRNPTWDAKAVTVQTPYHIREFITQKCGPKEQNFEGKKFSTAVSTRAALTYWYRSIRPNESTTEWRHDPKTGECHGLPTRSRAVSEFMMGLEKTKAKAGETSVSARALELKDMHRLYDHCVTDPTISVEERRQGVVRYCAYLFAFLMVLRIDETTSLAFESIDIIPGEQEYMDVMLGTRKSAQTGVAHRWRLHANDIDPKLCPMRMLILLAQLYPSSIPHIGPLFLKVSNQGAVLPTEPMSTTQLSRALTADLQALGYSCWVMYGTHSFRRGGCQYRVKHKDWTVAMVAAWGGWSQVEALTMFRYFYSPVDNTDGLVDYDRNEPKRLKST